MRGGPLDVLKGPPDSARQAWVQGWPRARLGCSLGLPHQGPGRGRERGGAESPDHPGPEDHLPVLPLQSGLQACVLTLQPPQQLQRKPEPRLRQNPWGSQTSALRPRPAPTLPPAAVHSPLRTAPAPPSPCAAGQSRLHAQPGLQAGLWPPTPAPTASPSGSVVSPGTLPHDPH